ncbi:hypothetical protein H8M03_07505 [Sphingomonas sabuli]|uniref:Uncharacterized protein n=1 Tax=Sphingomonas sabuli TaxID=2764186 RepID=A0A7G9KZU4_9SPHN|nr:DUF5985 family protein [Sphingomonas sabuli]QNM81893.1 hypothetical protein H8M03_07505 [Sphingomonas sabuli]
MELLSFLSGVAACGFVISGLFFLRFWDKVRDPLFLLFAFAFFLLGLGQTVLALGGLPLEERSSVFLIRLTAFLLIIFAIFRKNRASA